MPQIKPFRGILFNANLTRELDRIICPPYDIIPANEREQWKRKHPLNVVRVELPEKGRGLNPYENAAYFWQRWLRTGTVQPDPSAAFYIYRQNFRYRGKNYQRQGFFAALKVEPPGCGRVYAHEHTFPGPKQDRLALFQSIQANTSPIFVLYTDQQKQIGRFLDKFTQREKPLFSFRDGDKQEHQLWRVTEPKEQKWLEKIFLNRELYIADGHHRYGTAWFYAREKLSRRNKTTASLAAGYILTFLSSFDDPGLLLLPTHRLLYDLSKEEIANLEGKIELYCRTQSFSCFRRLEQALERLKDSTEPVFGYIQGGHYWLLTLQIFGEQTNSTVAKKSRHYQRLPVVVLQQLFLRDIPAEKISYSPDSEAVVARIQRREASAAFLLTPTQQKDLTELSRQGQPLPPKTTYFYPKLPTGLVFFDLRGEI